MPKTIMKSIFIILSLLIFYKVTSQTTAEFEEKARNYLNQGYIDSALHYYLKLEKKYPAFETQNIIKHIADCYIKLKDTLNAKRFYTINISVDSLFDLTSIDYQFKSYLTLAKLSYLRKDFNTAIFYIDQSIEKRRKNLELLKQRNNLSNEKIYQKFYDERVMLEALYVKSLSYYGIGNKDSVILTLAPVMATAIDNRIVRLFVTTCYEAYGKDSVRKELTKGIKDLHYEPQYTLSDGMIFMTAKVHIPFFKGRIELPTGPSIAVKKHGDIYLQYRKENLIEMFMRQPTYLLICEY